MIVRIQGEGQYRLADATIDEINVLDEVLGQALESGDEEFAVALAAILEKVHEAGEELAADELVESDVILPGGDATADEVKAMLSDEGLIPG
jgi:hypothetical protein